MPEFSLLQCMAFEVAVGLMAVVLSQWDRFQRIAGQVEQRIARLSRRPLICFAVIACGSIMLRLILLSIKPVPIPLFHDEFSYLLSADTFARGRLTNPTPPVATAFETIHVNLWPTYQSMYMPGTGLLLAIGRLLGCPWISVLLVNAILCAAVYWMVLAWLPRSYALVAGIIAVGISGNLNWWFDNYFCVALSSIGSVLVLGSLPRIVTRQSWRPTLLLGAGLVILMFTRPYEGFCVAFPCVAVLVWKMRGIGFTRLASLAAAPAAMLLVTFLWLLYYNWRGTGHPLLFPYMLDFRTYHITGPFLWSPMRPLPQYRLDILRRFYIFVEVTQYNFAHSHPWGFLARKVWIYYYNYLFGFGLLLLLGIATLFRRRREKLLLAPLLGLAGFALNVVLMAWAPFPQYAAPAAPLLLLTVMVALMALRGCRWARITGRHFVRGVLACELLLTLSLFGLRAANSADLMEPIYVSKDRAHVTKFVLSQPGKQLCLVRYTPHHEAWQEWVFNGADPESARLVWARSLSPDTDSAVIKAFPGRQVWLVQPDSGADLVSAYPSFSAR